MITEGNVIYRERLQTLLMFRSNHNTDLDFDGVVFRYDPDENKVYRILGKSEKGERLQVVGTMVDNELLLWG